MGYGKIALAGVVALLVWGAVIIGGALQGWWRESLAPPGDAGAFMAAASQRLDEGNHGVAALVLIENGRVFAEHYVAVDGTVSRDTVFPVASLSKWPAAYGVMTLVQAGQVDLDRPVSDYLSRWQLPAGAEPPDGVTVGRLLSHTAGLQDGLGFADYEPEETLPSLVQSLSAPRASSGEPVVLAPTASPGEWEYSGGGYLILELLVEEVSGQPFATFMHDAVFEPLGMARSSYAYLGDLDNAAATFDDAGRPAAHYRYAAKSATALATSPADLARFVIAQYAAGAGPLQAPGVAAMRRPHGYLFGQAIWGLGVMLYAPNDRDGFLFGHDGANEPAINSSARLDPASGNGIVVLSTGSAGLASSLGADWVLWQTGRLDFLAAADAAIKTLPLLLAGGLIILFLAGVLAWRQRRRT